VSAGLLVVFATHLARSTPEPAVTAQPLQPGQGEEIFMPYMEGDDGVQADEEGLDAEQAIESTPESTSIATPQPSDDTPVAPEPPVPSGPVVEETPTLYTFAEQTRGEVINLAGIELNLPDDAYVEAVMLSAYPPPGMENPPIPPLIVIRRNEGSAAVEYSTGRIFFGDPQDVSRRELDFLVQVLGEEKIVQRATPEATNAPQ
jgi:hypothetical protein